MEDLSTKCVNKFQDTVQEKKQLRLESDLLENTI